MPWRFQDDTFPFRCCTVNSMTILNVRGAECRGTKRRCPTSGSLSWSHWHPAWERVCAKIEWLRWSFYTSVYLSIQVIYSYLVFSYLFSLIYIIQSHLSNLSLYGTICLAVHISIFVTISLTLCLSAYWLSICPSVYRSICLSVYLSIGLSVCLSACLPRWPAGSLSIYI